MMPIGPLMIEHRLIERMIRLMTKEYNRVQESNRPDIDFMDSAIEFLETYADRCHHGKEEDILFRELGNKDLSIEHRRMMNELISEHTYARAAVAGLRDAKNSYARGNTDQLQSIMSLSHNLIQLYPVHIAKEDKEFFHPVMAYFDEEEQASMLEEFWYFDRNLIHEEYKNLVERMEHKSEV